MFCVLINIAEIKVWFSLFFVWYCNLYLFILFFFFSVRPQYFSKIKQKKKRKNLARNFVSENIFYLLLYKVFIIFLILVS